MPVYEPQEDSALLVAQVLRHARGLVLDMGTGSGLQAFTAAAMPEVRHVTAVDIDEESLAYARARLPPGEEKVVFVHSDLFTDLPASAVFDTILFNPPYLPAEDEDPHQALDGGGEGWELTARFLEEARGHLAIGGSILLLLSSKMGLEHVFAAAERAGYAHELLAQEEHFFEVLSVYRFWRR